MHSMAQAALKMGHRKKIVNRVGSAEMAFFWKTKGCKKLHKKGNDYYGNEF